MAASTSQSMTSILQTSHVNRIFTTYLIHITHISFINHHKQFQSSSIIITDCIKHY